MTSGEYFFYRFAHAASPYSIARGVENRLSDTPEYDAAGVAADAEFVVIRFRFDVQAVNAVSLVKRRSKKLFRCIAKLQC